MKKIAQLVLLLLFLSPTNHLICSLSTKNIDLAPDADNNYSRIWAEFVYDTSQPTSNQEIDIFTQEIAKSNTVFHFVNDHYNEFETCRGIDNPPTSILDVTHEYQDLAAKHGISLTQLILHAEPYPFLQFEVEIKEANAHFILICQKTPSQEELIDLGKHLLLFLKLNRNLIVAIQETTASPKEISFLYSCYTNTKTIVHKKLEALKSINFKIISMNSISKNTTLA